VLFVLVRSNDAGLAAAEVALEVEHSVLSTKSADTVGTTGIFDIKPNAINSVPRNAKLGIGAWTRAHVLIVCVLCVGMCEYGCGLSVGRSLCL